MAITAATTGKNRVWREINPISAFEEAKPVVSSAVTWYQGDLIYFDDSANLLKVVAATGNAATFCGIARNTVISGKLQGPYTGLTATDAAEATSAIVGPVAGVEAKMKLKASDAFAAGDKVYLVNGGDSQTVTVTDPGDANFVGFYQDAAKTASAGDEGTILIVCRYKIGAANV